MTSDGVLPTRLVAPEPGWTTHADVIVVGSGIAGLTAALRLREQVDTVLLVTKTVLSAGSTQWAQGGIAAALDPEDTPRAHLVDTLVAGVGVCDEDAVSALVTEGPARVRELIALGAAFDTDTSGAIKLTREGGHGADRIAHAGGDATGAEISRALIAQLQRVKDDPGIEVIEHALVVDLLTSRSGQVCGVTLHVIGEGEIDGIGAAHARAVVLATGGLGQIYSATTNPAVATGDGMAAALRAGAVLADLEFVQFHPTVLWLGEGSSGQQPLISEAVRGEGAFLVDIDGERFMPELHPQGDLAPRDVVSRAIVERMAQTDSDHVWLDARHLGADFLAERFPSIVARCRELGFDPATELLPVAPAQHYASGGVRTDLLGRSSVPGLYACGEVACTGVHGANRLASNSLLEGLVFAHRIAEDIADRLAAGELAQVDPVQRGGSAGICDSRRRIKVQRAMTAGAGVVRSAESLQRCATRLTRQARKAATEADPGPLTWETTNLLHIGQVLTALATRRQESRGGHIRSDFPDLDPGWRRRQLVRRGAAGDLVVTDEIVPEQPEVSAALAAIAHHLEDEDAPDSAPGELGFPVAQAYRLIATCLDEDLADGVDVTTMSTIPEGQVEVGEVVARQGGVIAGVGIIPRVIDAVARRLELPHLDVEIHVGDGHVAAAGEVLATLTGSTRTLLIAERTMLNILSRLSGVATHTRAWVEALAGTGCDVMDTRKTTPGMRALEKFAVRAGGGTNKRMGLYDTAMIKDNHKLAAGGLSAAIESVRTTFPDVPVEVEVETTAEALEAVAAGARFLLCDNFTPEDLRQCVDAVRGTGEDVELEATGGLSLEVAATVAATGVDHMSVGGLTHSSPILDIALDLREPS